MSGLRSVSLRQRVTLSVIGVLAAVLVLLGVLVAPFFPLGLVIPGGYVVAIGAGSALTGSGLPTAAKFRLPLVYAAMHLSWGWGFLTSPRKLARAPR